MKREMAGVREELEGRRGRGVWYVMVGRKAIPSVTQKSVFKVFTRAPNIVASTLYMCVIFCATRFIKIGGGGGEGRQRHTCQLLPPPSTDDARG